MTTPTRSAFAPPGFELAAASVAGRDHLRAGRNSQDAIAAWRGAGHLVGVVADGCGSAPHSEVGARLGARLLVAALARRLDASSAGSPGEAAGSASPAGPGEDAAEAPGAPALLPAAPPPEVLLESARQELLGHLRAIALGLCASAAADERALAAQVREHLLFTLVGAVIGPSESFAFALGDGLLEVNGAAVPLGPFPGNEPPYLGYALLPERLHGMPEAVLRLRIEARLPTIALRSLALGTDGACELSRAGAAPAALLDAAPLFRNPDALRRRLFLLARDQPGPVLRPGLLADDTTLLLLRRPPAAAIAEA